MHDILHLVGFSFLFIRFSYWVGSSLSFSHPKWKHVLFSQFCEGFLLFFIFSQLFGGIHILSMQESFLREIFGFFLVGLGTGGAFLAKRQLGKAWVYAAAYTVKPKQRLITTGLYSLVRHPIYSCFALSYIGIEVLAGSWLWISFFGFFIAFYFQAIQEEKLLLKHFGKKYQTCRARTKMLIPYLL